MSHAPVVPSLRAVGRQPQFCLPAIRGRSTPHLRSVKQWKRQRQLQIRCSSSNGTDPEADEAMDLLAAE